MIGRNDTRANPPLASYFSEDATVFFPPSAAAPLGRVQGRSEIERTFKAIFDAYPPRSNRPPTPIAPQDLLIQEYDGHAVVTLQWAAKPRASGVRWS